MAGIFLSYRRADSTGWAGRLHDSLQRQLPGMRIFMDVEQIPPGVKFADYIHEAVGACDVLIALIGPGWLDARDDAGQRRLDNPADFTRLEIVAALQREVRVIPTLVGGASMPSASQLPEALRGLCERQNFELHDRAWDDSCLRLSRSLQAGQATASAASPPPPASAGPAGSKRWLAGAAALGLVGLGLVVWSPWQVPAARQQAVAPAPSPAATPAPAPTGTQPASAEQAQWDSIQASGKPADFARYLAKYPAGAHATQARIRAGHWLASGSGCLVEDPHPEPGVSLTWSGGCAEGLADGPGVLAEFKNGKLQASMQATLRDGRPVGQVQVDSADGSRYVGDYVDGKMAGRVVVTMADGAKLEGNFVAGELVGLAVIVGTDGSRYEGAVRGFKPHGQGTLTLSDGQYVGGFVNGKREGHGTLVTKTGMRYEGGFIAGKPAGAGVLLAPNGNRLSGNFVNGVPDGRVTVTTASGQRSDKTFAQGKEVAAR